MAHVLCTREVKLVCLHVITYLVRPREAWQGTRAVAKRCVDTCHPKLIVRLSADRVDSSPTGKKMGEGHDKEL